MIHIHDDPLFAVKLLEKRLHRGMFERLDRTTLATDETVMDSLPANSYRRYCVQCAPQRLDAGHKENPKGDKPWLDSRRVLVSAPPNKWHLA